ncbi:MAG: YidC/Oxa1 family rane protein insertase [Verrucomicrobiota bacterium]|jgi:YidC/Oxa1 family membrane protein insertase|nr:YidC/Oxa1 family rane protein insertase [Verrucomicrobiota bacterium]
MDRTAWIAIVLASIGLVASIFWEQRQAAEARVKFLQQQAILAAQATPTPQATPVPGPAASDLSTKSLTDQGQHEEQPEQDATLKSDVAELNFSNNKGGLLTVGLLNHRAEQGQLVQLNTDRTAAIGAITQNPNTWQDSGYTLSTDSAAGTATLKRTAPGGLEITKVYTLAKEAGLKDDYQVNLSINFKNNGPASFDTPGFFVSAGAAEPIHRTDRIYATQFDWYRDGKFNSIAVNYFDPGKLFGMFQTSGAKDVYTATADKILWAGVSNQYFATILAPQEIGGQQVWAKPVDIPSEDGQVPIKAILGAIEIPGFSLQTGETKTVNFHIYAGPKEFTRLAKLPNDEADIMNFGWAKWVSELLLTVMNTLHAWVKSYALAIIIMTIIIRSLLWPLQNVATKSMRKMSKLSPIMNELREKYKDDPQRMNQETMKLYKEYGVNPFGGCLPMVVQIPIFFGFYGMLDKAIELRNSSFLWVHDLSQPDTVFHVGGIPINILPLVMAATQLWQMSITPKTGDPAQQRMFLFMPLIFLFICYNYASGLALYWTVQNLFFVAQMYLTRKQADAPLVKIPKAPQVAKRKSYR